MKLYQPFKIIRLLLLPVVIYFLPAVLKAQDKGTDVTVKITKDNDTWYAQPWVWIVGGAVFLLILVALLRGGRNSN